MSMDESRGPRRVTNRHAARPNDLRSILRSRGVQALLLGTLAVQSGAVLTGGMHDSRGKVRRGVVGQAVRDGVAVKMAANVVRAPLALVETVAPGKDAPAFALADKYRAMGYEISDGLAREIYAAAIDARIDPELAFGLVRTESEFKDYATSRVGAIGLTQLMLPTANWFKKGITEIELRESGTNLRIGFRYLRELIDRYEGDVELALTAYNRGTGTVDRVLKKGGNPDNGYAAKVLGRETQKPSDGIRSSADTSSTPAPPEPPPPASAR
ncbi:soluble lytic murein transglycosylase-like protein [Longimicrobium terrae]|uniref:Soluble lytic murein transglycosylase-like protein n=2 Tax=Longimicrobium terrae TaxID=1639882 RepID=A0A841GZ17_9BACT|nr:soluble lytic murein transglycosylase-like protein [Longimicrobium terrae]MBB6070997.1 soluble lytic murein transglycosylase-like protein [Longimicrobium terrae]NNC29019.1 lytic transglycosylase domain-containing protein [Longimicrobium terrae]